LLVLPTVIIITDGCKHSSKQTTYFKDSNQVQKPDTNISIRINGYSLIPKASLGFDTINKAGKDTLDLVICADYVYDPFGPIYDKSQLHSSILRKFDAVSRIDTLPPDTVELEILKHGSSRMILFFDHDDEADRHSRILKGEIYDQDVEFVNGIKIGMSLQSFYNKIFSNFPGQLLKDFRVVVFTSCVDGIKHVYSFKNSTLISVKFINDTYWKIDY
jgi:hypothetical protein